jgi:serine O-acetyltransferase
MDYDGKTVKQWAGSSQWRAWRADLARFRKSGYSGWASEGFWALTIYRLQHALGKAGPKWAWLPLRLVLALIRKLFVLVTHISLHPNAEIGPGLLIPHVGPLHVFPLARIGADCSILQVCTIGAGSKPGGPQIGDHVELGCHSCVLGPVRIGDGVRVGAGAVVVGDVPAWSTAVGVPARVVRTREPYAE